MMSMQARAMDLAATPEWFAQAYDPAQERLLFVRRSEADYRAISFLDQRSVRPGEERRILPWRQVADAVGDGGRRDVQYIFHIGHVGSTLVSRLLGAVDGVLAVREPLLLRDLAQLPPAALGARLDLATALLSRSFRPAQRVIVKATSFTSEIAHRLLPAGSRALLVTATAHHYIAGILAGDASRQELAMLAPRRAERLAGRCAQLPPLPGGEAALAAQAWACEMTSLEASAAVLPHDSTDWLDFDRFLDDAAARLLPLATFFGHSITASQAEAIVTGPLMQRYSKAPEHAYSPALRRDVLAEAAAVHGADIAQALGWLDRAARSCPLLAQVLDRSAMWTA